jgi:anti-sigma factor RsiW
MSTSTNNGDSTLLLHAYLDGELDPVHALDMERRLATDPTLAAERDRIAALRQAIGERLPQEPASDDLARFAQGLAGVRREQPRSSWLALAAAVVLAVCLSSGATWLAFRAPPSDNPANLVVASHMRALMAPQPTDVSSSDRHTVKPWFNGRVAQSPQVIDLTDKGFPLVGGRIDVVNRAPVPTLVYRHRQHLISLLAVPDTGGGLRSEPLTIAGYNILSWSEGGTIYWAVSDLGLADLEAFAAAFRGASRG